MNTTNLNAECLSYQRHIMITPWSHSQCEEHQCLTMFCSLRSAAPPAGQWRPQVLLIPDGGDGHTRTDPDEHMIRSAAGDPETHNTATVSLHLHQWYLYLYLYIFFYFNIKKWDLTVKSYVNSCEMFHVNRANLWTEAAGCAVLGWTRVHLTQQITVFLTWRSTFREQEGVLTIWQTHGSM